MTPHPFNTKVTPLRLSGPVGNGLPRTYIVCTDPYADYLAGVRTWVRQQSGWNWRELASGHAAPMIAPEALTELLLDLGETT
jgi:hypothetical protein